MQMQPSPTSAVIAPGNSSGNALRDAAPFLKTVFSDGLGLVGQRGKGGE